MAFCYCGWYASIAENQATCVLKVKRMNCSLEQIFVEGGHKTVGSQYWLAADHLHLAERDRFTEISAKRPAITLHHHHISNSS
jgi:hypothetical protein